MNSASALTELTIFLGDVLSQISTDRLNQAITQAFRDPWLTTRVFDTTSLVYSASTYIYAVPSSMTVVDAIYLQRSTSIPPEEISAELWEVVNGQIIFSRNANFKIPDTYTLQVRGRKRLTSADTITDPSMQNYLINVAAWRVLTQLGMSRIVGFLKNDTTLQELVGFRAQIQQDMLGYRTQLEASYSNN